MSIDFNIDILLTHTKDVCIAYVLALPIAWNREKNDSSAGLRTFPLVAVASCSFTLAGLYTFGGENDGAVARMMSGVVTGLGFLGGGAILKNNEDVKGTSTAISIWITGIIGICTAFQRYELSVLLSLLCFFTLIIGQKIKQKKE